MYFSTGAAREFFVTTRETTGRTLAKTLGTDPTRRQDGSKRDRKDLGREYKSGDSTGLVPTKTTNVGTKTKDPEQHYLTLTVRLDLWRRQKDWLVDLISRLGP